MGKFYILTCYYQPSTALINHTLSYIKAFSELGVNAEWVFLAPYTGGKSIPRVETTFNNITVKYLWKDRYARNRVLKNIYLHLSYAKFFLFSLKKGDAVLLMGLSKYLFALLMRKGVSVYQDRTEHPDVIRISKSLFWRRKYLRSLRNITGLFVISNALKSYFESVGVKKDKIHVINMVVDSSRFEGITKINNTGRYVAYCGNASNDKDGVDILIKSFAMVMESHPDVRLKIIGPAPQEGSENMRLVESLNIKDSVEFTGVVHASSMPQLLVDAEIVALARPNSLQNKYGFPTKLGEYLLSGNPVVVTKVGDIPLFLKDGETALMTECGNIEGFAEKLRWALDNPQQAREIGLRGKQVAKKNFNYLTETSKMVEVMFKQK